MGKRGPIPQTTTELKLHGGYRKHRHAKLEAVEAAFDGEPVKPSWLKGEAAKWWTRNVPALVKAGRVKAIDADALAIVAVHWADWRAAKPGRDRQMAYYAFHKSYTELAATPRERARSVGDVKPVEQSSLAAFARKRG